VDAPDEVRFISGVRLEWPFAAWVEYNSLGWALAVYDLRTHTVRYRTRLSIIGAQPWSYDIASDGSALLLVRGPRPCLAIERASLRAPKLHRIGSTEQGGVGSSGRRFAVGDSCGPSRVRVVVVDARETPRAYRLDTRNWQLMDVDLEGDLLMWAIFDTKGRAYPHSIAICVAPAN
jgi:hypothetical protein